MEASLRDGIRQEKLCQFCHPRGPSFVYGVDVCARESTTFHFKRQSPSTFVASFFLIEEGNSSSTEERFKMGKNDSGLARFLLLLCSTKKIPDILKIMYFILYNCRVVKRLANQFWCRFFFLLIPENPTACVCVCVCVCPHLTRHPPHSACTHALFVCLPQWWLGVCPTKSFSRECAASQ
jgi:hypothetical protein